MNVADATQIQNEIKYAKALDKYEGSTIRQDAGKAYLFTPLHQGENLLETLFDTQTSLDMPAKLKMALSACRGLQNFHQKGLLHRDVKLENIMFNARDGACDFIDFGLVESCDPTGNFVVDTCVGTELYLAPELLMEL